MKPTYVTFEQGKLLKDKGFIQTNIMGHTTKWYDNKGNLRGHGMQGKSDIPAPQQWEVVEWLRVNHGIWVAVNLEIGATITYCYVISGEHTSTKWIAYFPTPQEAYSEAFNYILKELI